MSYNYTIENIPVNAVINANADKGFVTIKGEFAKDMICYINQLNAWLKSYIGEGKESLSVEFKLKGQIQKSVYESLNALIATLNQGVKKGCAINLHWFWESDNLSVYNDGKKLAEDCWANFFFEETEKVLHSEEQEVFDFEPDFDKIFDEFSNWFTEEMNVNNTSIVSRHMPDLNEKLRSKTIRVFLSSTFADMQEERAYLINVVFPHLKNIAGKRGFELTEIDLRWGITEEDAKSGKVIRLCLKEIDLCREKSDELPFFIGLLGHRYGWQPTFGDVANDTRLLADFPNVHAYLRNNLSVTEMEMDYAVLGKVGSDEQLSSQAYFFTRSKQYLQSLKAMNPTVNYFDDNKENGERSLSVLKNKITEKLPNKISPEYESKEDLGRMVTSSFEAFLSQHFDREATNNGEDDFVQNKKQIISDDVLDDEQRKQALFAHGHMHQYIEQEDAFQKLDDQLEDKRKVVITGGVGSGKTAFMVNFIAHKQKHSNDCEIFYHFCGGTLYSNNLNAMLKRLIAELQRYLNWTIELPDNDDELPVTFKQTVSSLPKEKKYIIAIDAIDQLNELNKLNWLPDYISDNVCILLSVKSPINSQIHSAVALLAAKAFEQIKIKPLNIPEIEKISKTFLGAYSKELPVDLLHEITYNEESKNPHILRTLLEEIRLLGDHNTLRQDVQNYISSDSYLAFFEKVVERIERDFVGSRMVLSHLSVSHSGLTENEILGLLNAEGEQGMTNLEWSGLYETLSPHLKDQDGALTWSHEWIKISVNKSLQANPNDVLAFQKKQIAYFNNDRMGVRALNNLPWLYNQIKDWQELGNYISDSDVFIELFDERRFSNELVLYVSNLETHFSFYENIVNNIHQDEQEYRRFLKLQSLAFFYQELNELNRANDLFENALKVVTNLSKDGSDNYIDLKVRTVINLSNVALGVANFSLAKKYSVEAVEILGNYLNADKYLLIKNTAYHNLAMAYRGLFEFEEAKRVFKQNIAISERSETELPHIKVLLANSYTGLFGIYLELQQLNEAKEASYEALSLYSDLENLYPERYQIAQATAYDNLGILDLRLNKYEASKESFIKALDIYSCLVENNPKGFEIKIASIYNNLGALEQHLGNIPKAGQYMAKALEIFERQEQYNEIFMDTKLLLLCNLGEIYLLLDKIQLAEKIIGKAVIVYKSIEVDNASERRILALAEALNNLGCVYDASEEYKKSLAVFTECLELFSSLDKNNDVTFISYIARVNYNVGRAQIQLQDYNAAKEAFSLALVDYRKLDEVNPEKEKINLANNLVNSGLSLVKLHDYSNAIELYEEALDNYSILAEDDSKNMIPVIADTVFKLGIAYKGMSNYKKSKDDLEKALKIYFHLAEENSGEYDIDIAEIYIELGSVLAELKKNRNAEKCYRKGIEAYIFASEGETTYHVQVAESCFTFGEFYVKRKKRKKAKEQFEMSAELFRQLFEATNDEKYQVKMQSALELT